MNTEGKFSKRLGYGIKAKEITTREGAPQGLREFTIQTMYAMGYKPTACRQMICQILRKRADDNNWSDYPNIDEEINRLITQCDWYYVYDIIEGLAEKLIHKQNQTFHVEINDYFNVNGIGWKLVDNKIEYRGDEAFEVGVARVEAVLDSADLRTAKTEISEALKDLSRRPNPDITGAIQHGMACLECVVREATNSEKPTLGKLLKKYPSVVPTPLDNAIKLIWGFTSEQGRHLKEGREPSFEEAELTVQVAAAVSTYLAKKLGGKYILPDTTDLPF